MNPRVTDNDKDKITVSLEGEELRGWSYANDTERRQKMQMAREYVEGWCDATHQRQSVKPATEIPYNPAWTHGEMGFDEQDLMVSNGWRMRPDGSWFKPGS